MKCITVKKQKGVALVVGLVILLVLTMLGLSSMTSMTTELKVAGNTQDHNTAFQAAAAGLAAATDAVIDWTDTKSVQTINYVAPDSSSSALVTVRFEDCRGAPIGYELGKYIGNIHEIESQGAALDGSSNVIAQNTQVLGQQTIAPGSECGN